MIFINYRQDDTLEVASHLADRLSAAFGADQVFRDDKDIRPGERWPDRLREMVERCDVLLALIGGTWLKAQAEDGRRRLDDRNDWVRQEIVGAITHNKRVIVLLVGVAKMPTKRELPREKALRQLPDLQWMPLRPGRSFEGDLNQLITELRAISPPASVTPAASVEPDRHLHSDGIPPILLPHASGPPLGDGPRVWAPPDLFYPTPRRASLARDLELENDDAEERLQIVTDFIRLIDRLTADPKPDGILVTDLTGMAKGFSNWNNETCYQAILARFSRYARAHHRRFGRVRPGVIRSFFVDPRILDQAALRNLGSILLKHVAYGIGARVVVLGSVVPAGVIGDLGLYHGTFADEFFHLERVDRTDPGPRADVIDRAADPTRFKDIEERLRWVDGARNGSVIEVTHEGHVRECLAELARLAGIKPLQEPRGP